MTHDRPFVFISHISEDGDIAVGLEELIASSLLGAIGTFNTSNRKSILVGDPWRELIVERVRSCTAALIVCSPESVVHPWVNFESGGAWAMGRRVIPCCVRGMTKSSLPAPLGHLHTAELAMADDIRQIIEYLAKEVGLDPPSKMDYEQEAKNLAGLWGPPPATNVEGNESFIEWLEKAVTRPEKYRRETHDGLIKINKAGRVERFQGEQLRPFGVRAGHSVTFSFRPLADQYVPTYGACFANDDVADYIVQHPAPSEFQVTVKCLGQITTRMNEYPLHLADDPDDALEFEPAFLIESAIRINQQL